VTNIDMAESFMDHSGKRSEKRWYRKAQVGARYGGVCGRTIDRAVEDGRLPAPKYPFGNKIPYWDGDDLDAHDRSLVFSDRPQRKSVVAGSLVERTAS
jgi:hypothetical protein